MRGQAAICGACGARREIRAPKKSDSYISPPMSTPLENKRNIAILAHVNAGKTTVSERLLYFSAAITGTGEVDEGLATMDYLEEEKKRGITIEAGIASYTWKGVRVTFVDTPGHVDFGAEVDFALRSVEGAVLVVSGVGGVESQTLAAWEKIRRNGNAPLVFINKADLPGADCARALEQIRVLFKTTPVVLNFPVFRDGQIDGVIDVVHELALFRSAENPRRLVKGEIPESCHDEYIRHRQALIEFASRHDDAVLRGWLDGRAVEAADLLAGVRAGVAAGAGVPVCMGSALRNAGVRQLLNAVNLMLPPPAIPADADKAIGFVIKARWYSGIGKIFLAKIFSGRAARAMKGADFYRVFAETLEAIGDPGDGDIVAVRTDRPLMAGMHLGRGAAPEGGGYRPLLQARLEVSDASEHARVNAALRVMAEADPSIQIEADTATGGWIVRTVGELQLDVFCRRLKAEHGCDVRTGTPVVRHLEKPRAAVRGARGTAHGFGTEASVTFNALKNSNPDENHIRFPAGLDPLEEEVLRDCFRAFCAQGVRGRGEIAGLEVELTEIGGGTRPVPPPLLAKTFADALTQNLKSGDFDVFEPIMNLEIIVPETFCGAVLADLSTRGGIIRKIDADGRNSIIFLEIPLENVFGYATLLRSLSKGLGVFVLTYERHGVKKRS
jgi:elongation factor G